MVIPADLFEPVQKIQDTVLICAPVISQYAALGALRVGRDYCRSKSPSIAASREHVLEELAGISDICAVPAAEGAFYVLLRVDTARDPMELVERLVRDFGVAVIPGTTFGLNDGCYLRVSYGALTEETAAEGIRRLVRGLRRLT
jgi:aspartate/methionine/tyrosine aminotransferase